MSGLLVTRDLVDALVVDIAAWGSRTAETGGFLLATEVHSERMNVLALAGQAGITRRRGLFVISGVAIERLFSWAGDHEMRIRAQIHSHGRGAFLSPTDLRHGFDVDGFITSVVPNFIAPSAQPGDWGWWQRGSSSWEPRRPPNVVAGAVTIVRFDEAGIRAA